MNKIFFLFSVVLCGLIAGCGDGNTPAATTAGKTDTVAGIIDPLPYENAFHDSIDGKATALFVLKNKGNAEAAITNYGARVVSLVVPDKEMKPAKALFAFSIFYLFAIFATLLADTIAIRAFM